MLEFLGAIVAILLVMKLDEIHMHLVGHKLAIVFDVNTLFVED
jgi:hypothetical protein